MGKKDCAQDPAESRNCKRPLYLLLLLPIHNLAVVGTYFDKCFHSRRCFPLRFYMVGRSFRIHLPLLQVHNYWPGAFHSQVNIDLPLVLSIPKSKAHSIEYSIPPSPALFFSSLLSQQPCSQQSTLTTIIIPHNNHRSQQSSLTAINPHNNHHPSQQSSLTTSIPHSNYPSPQ